MPLFIFSSASCLHGLGSTRTFRARDGGRVERVPARVSLRRECRFRTCSTKEKPVALRGDAQGAEATASKVPISMCSVFLT